MPFFDSKDWLMLVSLGAIDNWSRVSKFGRNADIDTAAAEDVWTPGGVRTWLTAAVTLEAISADANDTAAGSGAQIITVQGLDGNFAEVEEDITMNGLGASSATSSSFIRVNRAFVKQVGTYHGNNAGTITIRTSGGGATQADIVAGYGQTEQTHYSLPTGKTAILSGFFVSTDGSKSITPTLWHCPGIDDVTTGFVGAQRKLWGATGLQGHLQHDYESPPRMDGPCDIWWSATVAANNTEVEAGFDLVVKTD